MAKTKKLRMQGPITGEDDPVGLPTHWRVIQVTNSIKPEPGKLLNNKQAQELCDAKDWEVTIIGFPN